MKIVNYLHENNKIKHFLNYLRLNFLINHHVIYIYFISKKIVKGLKNLL